MWGEIKRLFSYTPGNDSGEVRQAAQVNVSASSDLKRAAKQSSENTERTKQEVYSYIRPEEVILNNLINFMGRGSSNEEGS